MASTFQRSRKGRPTTEYLCDFVFRPIAHVLVLALLPTRIPPPAVVLANLAAGLAAALAIADGRFVLGALLVQLKTILDNADGQLARASGRETAFGRYLDSESDLLVNAALLAALGYRIGHPFLLGATFVALTFFLSVNYNLQRLYRREQGETADAAPGGGALATLYRLAYAPQDRLVEWAIERRLTGAPASDRQAYHDRLTVAIVHQAGMSTQLAVFGLCLAVGHPLVYCWFVFGCVAALLPLALRRDLRMNRNTAAPEVV